MNSKTELPSNVIAAIQSGHKINAIKLLREAKGLGLKEAKHAVDAYYREHPELQPPPSSSNGLAFVAVVIVIGLIVYQLTK